TSPTVLWVDDHPQNNSRERDLLESCGLRFILATSTAEALEKATTLVPSPNLVISDMIRADDPVAGYELLESLRHLRHAIPTIIYSSSCSTERRAEAKRLGALVCTNRILELTEQVLATIKPDLSHCEAYKWLNALDERDGAAPSALRDPNAAD